MMAADLTDPVADTVRALAVLQARRRETGLPPRLEEHCDALLHTLERTAPDVALIVESWLEAGTEAVLRIEQGSTATLYGPDGTTQRWNIDPDAAFALAPLVALR